MMKVKSWAVVSLPESFLVMVMPVSGTKEKVPLLPRMDTTCSSSRSVS